MEDNIDNKRKRSSTSSTGSSPSSLSFNGRDRLKKSRFLSNKSNITFEEAEELIAEHCEFESEPEREAVFESQPSTSEKPSVTSSSMAKNVIDLGEVEKIVENGIKEVSDTLSAKLHGLVSEVREAIQTQLDVLEGRVTSLELERDSLKRELAELKAAREEAESKHGDSERRLVELEQYSRKNNVRVFGIKENMDEVCRAKVSEILLTKLGFRPEDATIEVAHRVGKKPNNALAANVVRKPRGIIVRFVNMDHKMNVMKARKRLRGLGVSISEDLCPIMMKMLEAAKQQANVADAWAWNGKIWIKSKRNNAVRQYRYGDNINSLV